MIPYRDETKLPIFPFAVYGIVLVNIVVFLREVTIPDPDAREAFIDWNAVVPYHFVHAVQPAGDPVPTVATLVTSQFLHASFLHIFFNMLFLVVFGPEIEWLMGHVRFVLFYLVCGIIGNIAEILVLAGSHVPGIGASGAIAGVLGAFILRYPLRPIDTIVPIGCFPLFLRLPAFLIIGLWALVQFMHGWGTLTTRVLSEQGGGTAYFAHIGGFLAGVFLSGTFSQQPALAPLTNYRYYRR